MYESYFGFSATPFNLNPDPGFYFQSRGHGNALSYLKFGVHQGEGFVVVTGEIGAGKTTLVGALLSTIDPKKIVAAQIVSTQLEAGDLLRSVAIAFGIAPKNLAKADLIATIEAFLTQLVTQNRRALLIVDEAQNLNRAAVEELRMLSNFQLGSHALLQSFLVGQPELRVLLTTKPMEQFRQRVIASCHVGPMDAAETRAYVEHRLHKVGWTDKPSIEAAAFDRIHQWSAGIPRRVNLLCSRLLLSTYLSQRLDIDAAAVDVVARELRRETGESVEQLAESGRLDLGGVPELPPVSAPTVPMPREGSAPLLCVVSRRSDALRMSMVLRQLAQVPHAAPVVLLRTGDVDGYAIDEPFHATQGVRVPQVDLPLAPPEGLGQFAALLAQLPAMLATHRPAAVLLAGCNDAAAACAMVCHRMGVRLIHIGAQRDAGELNSVILENAADFIGAADEGAFGALIRSGVDVSRVAVVGDPLVDAVKAVPVQASALAAAPARGDRRSSGYVVVSVDRAMRQADPQAQADVVSTIRQLAGEARVVWLASPRTWRALDAGDLHRTLNQDAVSLRTTMPFVDFVTLVRSAACVVSDSRSVRTIAATVGVPFVALDDRAEGGEMSASGARATVADLRAATLLRSVRETLERGGRAEALPDSSDGRSAERLVEQLSRWGVLRGDRAVPGRQASHA